MTEKELIKQCRYYKGEAECPANVDPTFWECERVFVAEKMKPKSPLLDSVMKEYHVLNLEHVGGYDKVPMEIKALIFNRFCHHSDNSPEINALYFGKFYTSNY